MREPLLKNLKVDVEGTQALRSMARKASKITITIHTRRRLPYLFGQLSHTQERLDHLEKEIQQLKSKLAA